MTHHLVMLISLMMPLCSAFIGTSQKITLLKNVKDFSKKISAMKPNIDLINTGVDLSKNIKDLKFDSNKVIDSFVGKPIGDYWTYENLITNVEKNNVDSVSILTDKTGLLVIDKAHEIGNYQNENF